MKPRALILRTAGTNCDIETAYAFEQAGADAQRVHLNRLLESKNFMEEFQILAIPGGFSYGDDIAAGKIMANQLVHHLGDALADFVAAGKPIIGICNGFQVLVKTNLLPGPLGGRTGQLCTLAHNNSGQFIDRWVHLATPADCRSRCIWTADIPPLDLPIAHGEGKFYCLNESVRKALWDNRLVALQYQAGTAVLMSDNPANPNGSADDIAGICDSTGLVFGLMPHPERHIDSLQHPAWTRLAQQSGPNKAFAPAPPNGLLIFRNAVSHVQ